MDDCIPDFWKAKMVSSGMYRFSKTRFSESPLLSNMFKILKVVNWREMIISTHQFGAYFSAFGRQHEKIRRI